MGPLQRLPYHPTRSGPLICSPRCGGSSTWSGARSCSCQQSPPGPLYLLASAARMHTQVSRGWYTAAIRNFSQGIRRLEPDPTPEAGPMTMECEPHLGWSHKDILKGANKITVDYHGGQYFMLHDILLKFCQHMKAFNVEFRIYNINARNMPTRLANMKENIGLFDRIEVSTECVLFIPA
jgi:hypothetical protein